MSSLAIGQTMKLVSEFLHLLLDLLIAKLDLWWTNQAKDANIIGILVGTLGVGMHIVNLNINSYANVETLLECDLSYEV